MEDSKLYNGVTFYREGVDLYEDVIIPIEAETIIKAYHEQFERGMLVTQVTFCEDGTLLLHAQKRGDT